ncbi:MULTISPECIES: flagellar hook-length control protein FliK [Bradyrhizobium]|uniref:Flagellar hook-length control protein-like C-terminal domain-containing protein n=2 Tax=Bradyrhizobium TaxID=374 RepID=A0ABV4G002_9BRAD|nr:MULTISPECIES: flagellar hook-length control protein FliK [Bradyrhizobium]MBR1291250.1 flagellar hook-length control protein FliK [Bradyrhizobium ottawaense]MDA9451561.1 flagellar hook-length control protein FliK [Bradyrhizobium sp. CCBAU 21360]MDA9486562.1 flagellar hook-length control protein FliK [Bradyrhizobium sp. CCBAU 11445]MDA9518267.1 flagellar hook-length control protein FliK [Bradyrhizobium sp. CCBAU 11430]WLB43333.1 flagellar hook-length control protein FliK [Bradyrhizobium ottaw
MPTPVTSILPVSAASPVADATTPDLVLQAGSVVDARVVSVMADNLVRIAIANLSMDVVSEVALTPGQNLQLAVSQNDGTIRLAVMSGAGEATPDQITLTPRAASLVESPPLAPSATTTRNTLTPLEQVAVTAASAEAATKQGSQAPLFANLASVVTASDLPAGLKQAVLDVLAQQTPLSPGLDGADVETAFQKSGLFFEASLAAGARPPAGTTPDLKAALLVLRQTLTTLETAAPHGAAIPAATTGTPQVAIAPAQAAGEAAQSAPPSGPEIAQTPRNANLAAAVLADVAGNAQQAAMPRTMSAGLAASLLQEVTQNLPRLTGNVPGSNKTVPDGQIFEAASRATPPPFRGALPSPQAIASPSLAPDTPLSATVHRLIDDTDAAIARQTLLQIASLPDRTDASGHRIDPAVPQWNFEIPFATPQGTAMAQFEISRDGAGESADAAKRAWRARFSLNVEPAGPVHALITLNGDKTFVRMWAERPATVQQLRAGIGELNQALTRAELNPGDILVREGTPPQPAPARAGHFLDRAT